MHETFVGRRRADHVRATARIAALVAVSSAALTASMAANAQEAAPILAETAQAPSADVETITVTGSRLQRNGFASPTPVTVLNTEDINRVAPSNLADFVNKLPAFSNSPSTSSSGTSVSDGNGGANYLNLRSLGPNRTLILLDGIRVAPTSIGGFLRVGGAVDINEFPDALIKRIDVVTGGASAAYGSDALAGVVNFVLDKDFTGLKGVAQGGVTTYGDDRQYRVSLTAGTGFDDDRGHLLASGSFNHTDGIPDAGVRKWAAANVFRVRNPAYTATNGQPYYLQRANAGGSTNSPGGLITTGPLAGTDFGPGGVPRQFIYGTPNDGSTMIGGDWRETAASLYNQFGPGTQLDSRVSRLNLFGRASYDITDAIQIYGQVTYANTKTGGACCYTTSNLTIRQDNPFLPASILARMQAAGVSSFGLRKLNTDLGQNGTDNKREFTQYLVGATGKLNALGKTWSWDVAATRSQTTLNARTVNNIVPRYVALAADVVTNPATGLPICRSTLTNPTNGCQPYNPFGTGVANPQSAIDYFALNAYLNQRIRQDFVSATVRGEPFSLWAGPVSLAVGFEHRKDSVKGDTDELDTTNSFWDGNYHATSGSYNVNEVYAETAIPLAEDMRFAKSLELNAAVRYTDYSTSGAVTTWKVGATYAPISDIRFRVTRSRDIRAPNLGELYQAGQANSSNVTDPFQGNNIALANTITVGNPDLRPEVADTTGLGVVFQPAWFEGFSASFDYYKINIKSSIATLSQQDELNQCFAGNQSFCGFINRDANGNLTTIYVRPANTASTKTRGFDIEASYRKPLERIVSGWAGTLSVRALATHVIDLTTITPDGQAQQGVGSMDGSMLVPIAPHWSYSVTLGYDNGPFSGSVRGRGVSAGVHDTRWTECSTNCPTSVAPNFTIDNNRMPGAFYVDLSATYRLMNEDKRSAEIFVAVDNVFNNNPGGIAFYGNNAPPYDTLGRLFRAGVRFRM